MEKGKKKKFRPTSFRLSPVLLKKVQHECIDRDITQADAVKEALELWLGQSRRSLRGSVTTASSVSGTRGGHGLDIVSEKFFSNEGGQSTSDRQTIDSTHDEFRRELLGLLEDILNSGNPDLIDAITSNLRVFQRLVRIDSSSSDEVTNAIIEDAEETLRKVETVRKGSRRKVRDAEKALRDLRRDNPEGDEPAPEGAGGASGERDSINGGQKPAKIV